MVDNAPNKKINALKSNRNPKNIVNMHNNKPAFDNKISKNERHWALQKLDKLMIIC
jgi:hypothetical protein